MRAALALIYVAALPASDFRNAVLAPPGVAASVLREEIAKRTAIKPPIATNVPPSGPAIIFEHDAALPPEAYRLKLAKGQLRIASSTTRGAIYGAGHFLRRAEGLRFEISNEVLEKPAYPIRGHQLGYRHHANSYDAWTVAQMDQYIRELAFFGANSIEAIPFQDERTSSLMKVSRREMNRAMSEICARYTLDYWAWIPAEFDLKDNARRTSALAKLREFFADAPRLNGLFFPGGDPGNNPPSLVLPYLAEVASALREKHPEARIWLSLQMFDRAQVDEVYRFIERESPAWLGGLVAGPSSPPIAETRARLPRKYGLRLYPDITHNKLSQYEVPGWDQAFARTLGREAINPRPTEYAAIHNRWAAYSSGFISYSDGAHDDVNKAIWSALAWNPGADPRDVLMDYARVFFGPNIAAPAADAILALERNWRGPLIHNGAVEATLAEWNRLTNPRLETNWRWQMLLLRANYDAFIRRKLIQETKLEQAANHALEAAPAAGSAKAIERAITILAAPQAAPDLRARIVNLCERLFQSIGLQTSVPKYQASDAQRGAVLDFIDLPQNNRWWLEDEFKKVSTMPAEPERVARLLQLARWENPGAGSFYDSVGNESKSPHVQRGEGSGRSPTFWWIEQGKTRMRVSWQATLWPSSMVFEGIDPAARYVVRSSGSGQALLRINGEPVAPRLDPKDWGAIKEFDVPAAATQSGRLVLTWDTPSDEGGLNWRQRSRLAEVWLIKQTP